MMAKKLTTREMGELAQLRHIRNLLKTALSTLEIEFVHVTNDETDAIRVNVERAKTAAENAVARFHQNDNQR